MKDVFEAPHYSEEINVRGTINVLEAARRSGVKRVICGSNSWVYSEAEGSDVDEDTPLHAPSHLYTATKMAGECYCKCYAEFYGVSKTVLRYGIPYGPRARDGAVVPIYVTKAIDGEALTIAGDGSQFRKFVYIEGLAEGTVKALRCKGVCRVYNLVSTEKVTIKQIAEVVEEIVGDVTIDHVPARPGVLSGKEVSSERTKTELGYEASRPFNEGVRKYVDWFRCRALMHENSQKETEQVAARL